MVVVEQLGDIVDRWYVKLAPRKHLHNILKRFCFRAFSFCVHIVLNHMQQSTK